MDRKNIYIRRSKISEAKFRLLVRPFALDLTATECAALTGISVRPVNSIYLRIRERVQQWCMQREVCVQIDEQKRYTEKNGSVWHIAK